MKLKKFIFVLFLMVLFFPNNIEAMSCDEAQNLLDSFDEKIVLNSINPNLYKELASKDDYDYKYFFDHLTTFYLKYNGYNTDVVGMSTPTFSGDKINISVDCFNEQGEKQFLKKEVTVEFLEEYDEKTFEKAKKILKSFKEEYNLDGMNSINSLYHNGTLDSVEDRRILTIFPEIKEILELNPEFDYEISQHRGGGSPYGRQRYIAIGIYQNDVLYAYREISIVSEHFIYVDKDLPGTIFEKAEDRLNEYFNNSVKIKFDIDGLYSYGNEPFVDDILNNKFGTNINYNIALLPMYLNDEIYDVTIVEVDKKYVDKFYMKSIDKETGINVYTESYDVPIDSSIKVQNVLNKNYIINAMNNNNLNFSYAFDINLISNINQKYVNKIINGIKVYIPVTGYKVGSKLNVYYVKENANLGEKIIGTVISKDGKLFVEYETNHFSTYAIEKKIYDNTTNDSINNSINNSIDNSNNNEKKSNNNYLSSINLSVGIINFDKEITEYSFEVNNDISTIEIISYAEDDKAIVYGNNIYNLNVGDNIIKIKVVAEDNSEKTYTLNIKRNKKLEEQNIAKEVEEKNNYLIMGIISAVIIIIIIVLIKKALVNKN